MPNELARVARAFLNKKATIGQLRQAVKVTERNGMKVEVRCYCTDMKWETRALPLNACGGCGDFFEVRAPVDKVGEWLSGLRGCCREHWQAGRLDDSGHCPECGAQVGDSACSGCPKTPDEGLSCHACAWQR